MRRQLTDWQVLDLVLRNWHEQGRATGSVRGTAGFLWLLGWCLVMALCIARIAEHWPWGEQHGHRCANAASDVECPQRDDADAGREGDDVVHGGESDPLDRGTHEA